MHLENQTVFSLPLQKGKEVNDEGHSKVREMSLRIGIPGGPTRGRGLGMAREKLGSPAGVGEGEWTLFTVLQISARIFPLEEQVI